MSNASLTRNLIMEDMLGSIKKPEDFRIGVEHEVFLFRGHKRATYNDIQKIFDYFVTFGWERVFENENTIALKNPFNNATISLEPGGQFELSGSPLKTLTEVFNELESYQKTLVGAAQEANLEILYKGFDHQTEIQNVAWMPKARYQLMSEYMPQKGSLGLDMMTRTCTVQGNFDFSSETDMAQKFRVAMCLQPLVSALWGNSNYNSLGVNFSHYRTYIWQNTDSDRTGILPFVFQNGFGFEEYVDYILNVPMYFIRREGRYIDARGIKFLDFMKGRALSLKPYEATLEDWHDQLTVAFPEVRLKSYLEVRGADVGPPEMIRALPAFWVGMMYDSLALSEILEITHSWTYEDVQEAYLNVPQQGLQGKLKGKTLGQWAKVILEISQAGLDRWIAAFDSPLASDFESSPLFPLFGILQKNGF
jgi:glutamate--cysteine ligase